ncbi:hypothetical protein [Pararcticibacter amylolyticus]|uniref:Uncharacterized protein n=1 Tax=Pararcticibacter amylolyticus TaxID=2173175 RepID=A0A2U2P9L4_9SPHI|nr:hypothetical protein [Pararcticibacter amylolyticus]PWG78088.1 hypothetical protein DDR33_24025 [Pararcticibacter amylolyticus]
MRLIILLIAVYSSYGTCSTRNGVAKNAVPIDTLHQVVIGSGYKVIDVKNESTNKREIGVWRFDKDVCHLALPSQDDYMGFSVNWIKKTSAGFQLSIEYGSRIYYRKDFNFYYINDHFYLTGVRTERFDKSKDEKGKTQFKSFKPPIPIENVIITDYM